MKMVVILDEFKAFVHEDVLHFIERNPRLQDDLKEERDAHSKLAEHLKRNNILPKFWYYGHHHSSYLGEWESTNYRLLNVLEICPHTNP